MAKRTLPFAVCDPSNEYAQLSIGGKIVYSLSEASYIDPYNE